MTPDPIEQLLRLADGNSRRATVDPAALAETVRRRVRVQRARRIVAATACAAALAVGLFIRLPGTATTKTQVAVAGPPDPSFQPQIDSQSRLIERMLMDERLRSAKSRLVSTRSPMDAAPVERAAARVVVGIDRVFQKTGEREAAIAALESAARSFPDTTAAGIARARAAELRKEIRS